MPSFLSDPSLPSWINALTVAALAIVIWSYARSAKRQANAAESQAKAAIKQANAAERQLAILQAQIESQAGAALTTLKANVTELREAASDWYGQMSFWGRLGPQSGVDLLPAEWTFSVEHARKVSPELFQELLSLQRSSRSVSRRIEQFTSTQNTFRTDVEANTIKGLLNEIRLTCDEISSKLGNLG
jgi:hypothetical protein